jgi:Tol biopolymer transport system component
MTAFSRPRFSPDGRNVVVQGAGLFSIDLESGVATALVPGAGRTPTWSRDGMKLFYEGRVGVDSVQLRDLRTGTSETIWRGKSVNHDFNIAPSPNDDMVAMTDGPFLRVVNVMSRELRTLLEIREPEKFLFPGSLAWTPDSRWLLFGKMNGSTGELWRIAADGGTPQFAGLALPDKYIYFLRVRPDGRQLAFAIGDVTLPRGEIWELRNFVK